MTLSEFSFTVRRAAPVVILGFTLFIVFFVLMRMLFTALRPSAPQTVYTPAFGKIDPITFSQKIDYPPNPLFTIDNIEGRPITASSSADIYFVPQPTSRFGYAQALSFMAKAVGFSPETNYALTGTEAVYENGSQRLKVDISNFNFTFDLNFEQQPEIFDNTIIPDEINILNYAIEFLRKMNRYPSELAQGTNNVIYLKYEPTTKEFNVVENISDANVVEIDLFPPDIGVYPIVPPKYFNSQNYVVMVFKPRGYQVIKAQIKHFSKDIESAAPYPLKSGDLAWEELKNGKGTIVSSGQNTNQITIREMFVGYYDPDIYQPYFQPVYVFLGDNNFAAYVPAIQEEYVKMIDESL